MPEKYIGQTSIFKGGDSRSLLNAINEAVHIWTKKGLPENKIIGAYEYLVDHETPHALEIPKGKTGRFALYLEQNVESPKIRAAVRIKRSEFTDQELRRIISAPGDKMSKGDKRLLRRLDDGNL